MTDQQARDLDATRARQGRRGMHVVVILAVSLGLIVLGYLAIYVLHAGHLSGHAGQTTAAPSAARAFNGPEPSPQVTNPPPGYSPPPQQSQPSPASPS